MTPTVCVCAYVYIHYCVCVCVCVCVWTRIYREHYFQLVLLNLLALLHYTTLNIKQHKIFMHLICTQRDQDSSSLCRNNMSFFI